MTERSVIFDSHHIARPAKANPHGFPLCRIPPKQTSDDTLPWIIFISLGDIHARTHEDAAAREATSYEVGNTRQLGAFASRGLLHRGWATTNCKSRLA